MSYRANKIRQALIQRVAEVEWTDVLEAKLWLDPQPYQCAEYEEVRHPMPRSQWLWVCGTFSPRPGYEQDRSKYEH